MPLSRGLARFNRRFANPVMRLVAGRLPPFAIVRHRGRRTGRDYVTPVLAFGTEDGAVIGVLYGTGSDWVSNVLVAGGAEVKRRREWQHYGQSRLVGGDEGLRLLPTVVRSPFRLLGVRAFVRLSSP
ncbi:MAG TPA: nitroreductase family deazaflavin-dependent oxidoreductase [Kribbella sp.]|nr:nitroreductase family deazaflavin-dependent oxidoreductase [Kribbella sp.]